MRVPQGRMVHLLTVVAIAALLTWTSELASAQAELGPSSSPFGSASATLGAREATTYLNFPIQRLKAVVPALGGIKYDDRQDQLPVILGRVAQHIADVLPRLPNLISREDVYHFQSTADADASGGLAATQPWGRQYRYLLQCQRNRDGSTSIAESRIDGAGKPVKEGGGFTSVRGYGFSYQWLFFTAASQLSFTFATWGNRRRAAGRRMLWPLPR